MARRRFHAPRSAFDAGGTRVALSGEEARHLRDVLRLKRGDEVFVFDGEGQEYRCQVEEARRDVAELSVSERVEPASPESPLRLTLACALLKGEKFDLVVQKATELGVARILPVITKQSDVRLRDEQDGLKRTSRWQRIALEAAKQSGRARVPVINAPVPFISLLKDDKDDGPLPEEAATRSQFVPAQLARLLFSERGGRALHETLAELAQAPRALTALVGPEGGWTNEELDAARAAGWSLVTLGGRILRAETAAIIVTALLQHLLGDMR